MKLGTAVAWGVFYWWLLPLVAAVIVLVAVATWLRRRLNGDDWREWHD